MLLQGIRKERLFFVLPTTVNELLVNTEPYPDVFKNEHIERYAEIIIDIVDGLGVSHVKTKRFCE